MSLILDALKKSEEERRRGQPPGLHANVYSATRRRPSRAPWVAGAGAVLLAAGLSAAWFYSQRDVAAPAANLAGTPTAVTPAPISAPAVPAASAPVAAAPDAAAPLQLAAAEPPPESADSAFGGVGDGGAVQTVSGGGLPVPVRAGLYTPSTLPVPTVVGTEPAPAPVADVPKPDLASTTPAAAPVPTLPAQPDLSAVQPISTAAVDTPQTPAEVLPNMYQLPYGVRKDLPKLSLTMHVYSPVPEERFVVLNGKRYTLDSLAPGPDLNLVEIVADGVVMEFRGQRFLLPRQAY